MTILTDSVLLKLRFACGKQVRCISSYRITPTVNKILALLLAIRLTTFSQQAGIYESDAETRQPSSQRCCNVLTQRSNPLEEWMDKMCIHSKILTLSIWLHATLRLEEIHDSEIAKAIRTALLHAVKFGASRAESIVLSSPDRFMLLRGTVEIGNQLSRLEDWQKRSLLHQQIYELMQEWLLPQSSFLPVEIVALEKPRRVELLILEYCPDLDPYSWVNKLLGISWVGATVYRSQHGSPPQEREQFVSSATRIVKVYIAAGLSILESAIRLVIGD